MSVRTQDVRWLAGEMACVKMACVKVPVQAIIGDAIGGLSAEFSRRF